MKRICKQCGKEFELSQSEINFYNSKNLSLPKRCKVLFCTLDDAPLVRLNDGVSAWMERIYANYLRLFEQFI